MFVNHQHWEPAIKIPTLAKQHIHVWRFDVAQHQSHYNFYYGLLNDAQQQRAQKFYFDADRHCFVIAHGALRYLLSQYLHCSSTSLKFNYNQHGKPELENETIRFNISHTRQIVLIAVCLQHAVGVDVETRQRNLDVLGLSQRVLTLAEIGYLSALPNNVQQSAFIKCWTRKEALLKAIGSGFSNTYSQQFQTTDERGNALSCIEDQQGQYWNLVDLPYIKDCHAALVIEQHTKNVVVKPILANDAF